MMGMIISMMTTTYDDQVSEELFYLIEAEKMDDTKLLIVYQKNIDLLHDVKQMILGKKEHNYTHKQFFESRHVMIQNLRAEEKVLTSRRIPHIGWDSII